MKQMLEQLMGAGKGWLNDGGDTRKAQMKGMAQGGLAAGAMALLLGTKKMRKYGTKVAAVGGAAALGSYAAPLAQAMFCPTGGIMLASAPGYLQLPNVLCVGGSWLTPKAALAAQDWELVEALAREAVGLRPGG